MREGAGRMLYRRWTMAVFLAILSVCAIVILTNYTVDAYSIVRTDFNKQIQEPNKNYLKIKFLLDNPNKYDSFLFGSSRVNGIDVEKISAGRFYNMTYSEGLPQEHLANARFLLRHGVKIKTLLLGLDDFSYRVDPQRHYSDLLRQPYPDISGKSWIAFYAGYFMNWNRFYQTLKAYALLYLPSKGRKIADDHPGRIIFHDIYGTGRVFCSDCDREIENDPDKHRHDAKFDTPFHYDGDNLTQTVTAIKEFVTFAKKNSIRLIVFINPIHKTTYLDTDLPLMMRFKKEMAAITDYYDFSGLNSITTNNYYYHETSHYREMVGDMMLRRMFGYPPVAVPADFGVLVNENNVVSHIDTAYRQIAKYGSLHRKVVPSAAAATLQGDKGDI